MTVRPKTSPRSGPRLGGMALAVVLASSAAAQVERYRLTVDNTWSTATHPGLLPSLAHFSWLAGGTHDATVTFWRDGSLASPGIVQMAETGATFALEAEVAAAILAGSADNVLAWHHWFCPTATTIAQCGPMVVEFDVDAAFPLVSLATMLGPSPDWFVGVDSLPLRDGNGWLDQISVDVRPYDGGTRSANVFALGGSLTLPPDPVAQITAASGQLIGPASLGTFLFQRVAAIASTAVRNGSGINPVEFSAASQPVLGASWSSSIAVTPAVGSTTLWTAVGLGFASDPGSPLFGFELFVVPPLIPILGNGSHAFPIPASPTLAGFPLFAQGVRAEQFGNGQVVFVLTNALDLVLGY